MSFIHVSLILVCVLALAIGQLLFKYTAQTLPNSETAFSLLSLSTNIWFLLSLLIYGSATVLWVYILRHVSLTVAYPFFALSFVIVPLLSAVFLGEQVDMGYWIGIGFIIIGITITIL
jgi:drug/metabolite transporter (DMT)-like permease